MNDRQRQGDPRSAASGRTGQPAAPRATDGGLSALRVAIVGGGPVGALLAILLAQRGATVEVFDGRPAPAAASAGTGRSINITLAERGWAALRAAGAEAGIRELCLPLYGRRIHDSDGSTSFHPYTSRGDAIYSVSRDDLHRRLVRDALATDGVTVRFGHRCLEVDPISRTIHLAGPSGAVERRAGIDFDLCVGADGSYSAVRQSLLAVDGFEFDFRFSPVMYKELSLGAPGSPVFSQDELHLWPRGDGMIVAFPNRDGSHTVSLFLPAVGPLSFESLSSAAAAEEFFQNATPDLFEAKPGMALDLFRRPPALLPSTTVSTLVFGDWLALAGDAAHSMVPFLGQGLNTGLEDVHFLVDGLCTAVAEGADDAVGAALASYDRTRGPNTRAITELAAAHFTELAEAASDPLFARQKLIEQLMAEVGGEAFRSSYELISFTRLSQMEVARRSDRVSGIARQILGESVDLAGADRGADVEALRQLVADHLAGIDPADDEVASAAPSALSFEDLSSRALPARARNPHRLVSEEHMGQQTRSAMTVAAPRLIEDDSGMTRVVSVIDAPGWDRPFEAWFEIPTELVDPDVAMSGDPWLAALILPAMREGLDIEIDAKVSNELMASLSQIEGIYSSWLRSAGPIDVRTRGPLSVEVAGADTGLFFSCGVDSWYSLLKSEDRRGVGRGAGVTHLINVHGVDIDVGEWKANVAAEVAENTRRIAESFGLGTVAVSTNIRHLYTFLGLSWHWGQAGGLGAVALLLQARFSRVLTAAGPTNANVAIYSEMEAGGCHPLLVPLFSSALCEMVVDGGELSRLQKVERVAQSSRALETLRICWANHEQAYNCGRCAKCVRTAMELEIVGALDRCTTLPGTLDPDAIRRLQVLFPHEVLVLQERRDRLADRGASPAILDAIDEALRRVSERDEGRERAMHLIAEHVSMREPAVILDQEDLRFDLATDHAALRPFPSRNGYFDGLPEDGTHAVADLTSAVAGGAMKFIIWRDLYWALDYYPELSQFLDRNCPTVVDGPDVKIFDLSEVAVRFESLR